MPANRDVILNIITRLKGDRKGGLSGGMFGDLKAKNDHLEMAKKKVDQIAKKVKKVGRLPILSWIKKISDRISALGGPIGRVGNRIGRIIKGLTKMPKLILFVESAFGKVWIAIKLAGTLLLRFAGPLAVIATAAIGMWKWITFWKRKGAEADAKGLELDKKRLELLKQRFEKAKLMAKSRSTLIENLINNNGGRSLDEQRARAAEAVGLAEQNLNEFKGLTGGKQTIEGYQNQIRAIKELQNAVVAGKEIEVEALNARIAGYDKLVGRIEKVQAILKQEEDEKDDIRLRLGRLSPAERAERIRLQHQLNSENGSLAERRVIALQQERGGFGSEVGRAVLRSQPGTREADVSAFASQRSEEASNAAEKVFAEMRARGARNLQELLDQISQARGEAETELAKLAREISDIMEQFAISISDIQVLIAGIRTKAEEDEVSSSRGSGVVKGGSRGRI